MTKGVPSRARKFKNQLMGEVARERLTHLTPQERDAICVPKGAHRDSCSYVCFGSKSEVGYGKP